MHRKTFQKTLRHLSRGRGEKYHPAPELCSAAKEASLLFNRHTTAELRRRKKVGHIFDFLLQPLSDLKGLPRVRSRFCGCSAPPSKNFTLAQGASPCMLCIPIASCCHGLRTVRVRRIYLSVAKILPVLPVIFLFLHQIALCAAPTDAFCWLQGKKKQQTWVRRRHI